MVAIRDINVQLGKVAATSGALEVITDSSQSPADFISRHVRDDWGQRMR